MTAVNKIDSNVTGLAYAEEASLGTLGGSPVWYQLEPNSYNDFGGEITTVAPNPINPTRQRRKGVTTDLDASGGFNHNLTFHNLTDLMQGVLFAAIRDKGKEEPTSVTVAGDPDVYDVASTTGFLDGSLIIGVGFASAANNAINEVTAIVADTTVGVLDGQLVLDAAPATGAYIKVVGTTSAAGDIDVDSTGDYPELTSTTLDFTTLGLVEGQWIYIGGDVALDGFLTAANNGYARVKTIAANSLILDKTDSTMATEANTLQTVRIFFGDVLRNEAGALITRKSYQLERLLGAPDDASTDVQSEALLGAVPNEVTFNIPSAELVNVDMSFVAIDNEQRTAGNQVQASVSDPISADEYNTSSDVGRIKLAGISLTDANPTATFAYVTEATISINNNVSPNKAVGVLGAFDVTAGTFEVSGSLTAYFSTVAAVSAVRNNDDITLDIALIKDNQGIVFDFPLIALGDGRLNVEIDQPITLPLNADAANGADYDANMDHTLLVTYFNYLPTAAM